MDRKILLFFLFLSVLFLVSCKNTEEPTPNKEPENINEPEPCTHVFENGRCTLCGYICTHEFSEGVCTICGFHCSHSTISDGICDNCGFLYYTICEHEWLDGVCNLCGYYCPHTDIYDAICKECDMDFSIGCEHEYVDGVCKKCGFICHHNYVDSVCTKCGYHCPHPNLRCGDICKYCGYQSEHEIVEGKCVICGKRFDYVTEIPSKYLNTNCPQKGTVEKVVFQSYDYNNNRPFENTFFVYLPYGYYDNTDEYNVFYLTHGSGENAAYWLAQLSYQGGYTEKTKVVLDNMHYYGLCEPTIVVTPTENLNGTASFYKELVENIMPLAETKYRTKAHLYGKDVNSVDKQTFIDSRMYRAYAGLSRGSMIGYSIMAYDMAYFGYYGYYSGGSYGLDKHLADLVKTLNDKNNPYKIYYVYHSCGTNDAMYQNHVDDYKTLLRTTNNKLVEYENTEFFVKEGFSHNYNAWIVDLYNSLGSRFFKYNDED